MILGDTGVELNFVIKDGNSFADLTNTTVNLIIKGANNVKTTRVCTILDPKAGKVQYVNTVNDFPTSGNYKLALKINYADGDVLNSDVISLIVKPGI